MSEVCAALGGEAFAIKPGLDFAAAEVIRTGNRTRADPR